jgi:hypothetical protein
MIEDERRTTHTVGPELASARLRWLYSVDVDHWLHSSIRQVADILKYAMSRRYVSKVSNNARNFC